MVPFVADVGGGEQEDQERPSQRGHESQGEFPGAEWLFHGQGVARATVVAGGRSAGGSLLVVGVDLFLDSDGPIAEGSWGEGKVRAGRGSGRGGVGPRSGRGVPGSLPGEGEAGHDGGDGDPPGQGPAKLGELGAQEPHHEFSFWVRERNQSSRVRRSELIALA